MRISTHQLFSVRSGTPCGDARFDARVANVAWSGAIADRNSAMRARRYGAAAEHATNASVLMASKRTAEERADEICLAEGTP
jgi:hypothetical protein